MISYQNLTIERLGQRGEGIAEGRDGPVFVPYALPGDEIIADVDGERGSLTEVTRPSPQRISPFCQYYSVCGGCAVQALADEPYRAWKRGLLVSALEHARIAGNVAPLVDAHGEGRRRATFHARVLRDGLNRASVVSGFMRSRAHDIVDIEECPVLAPAMKDAPDVARAIAQTLSFLDKPLDITITATLEGLDVDFRGTGKLDENPQQKLVALAGKLDLARLSNHGDVVIERRIPRLSMGRTFLSPPPGMFLQATQAGEEALTRLVCAAAGKSKRIADLFAGVGTFTLRLAEQGNVHAVEYDAPALLALEKAAHNATGLKSITTEVRDLFRRPLAADDLTPFDAIVFDPPRAGAEAQARALAESKMPLVIAVSCNVQTFARDARILINGGYEMGLVTPVDQFRHSAHVEMVAAFTKKPKTGAKRRLLG